MCDTNDRIEVGIVTFNLVEVFFNRLSVCYF